MPVTYFVALPFIDTEEGPAPGEAVQCPNGGAAVAKAAALARIVGNSGAVAFSRTGEPELGDFEEAVLLRSIGIVPDEFSGAHALELS